jgi:predicted transcriptional regulator
MKVIMPIEILRGARLTLELGQQELAELSGVSLSTVFRVEKGTARLESVLRVQNGLEKKGVVFLQATANEGPGFRLPKR